MHMDLNNYIKKLPIIESKTAPTYLEYSGLIARPLTRNDIDDDLVAVNENIEIIKRTRGGKWPTGQLTKEEDLLDLAWHEREFNDGNSFAYVVRDESQNYIGCFYLYGLGYRTLLTEGLIDFDVDASWWVTKSAYDKGMYSKLQEALNKWLVEDFGFKKPYFSNVEIPGTTE